MEIRKARASEAEQACMILRRSIAELCTEDHRGDAELLGFWLYNKTSANVQKWIEDPQQIVLVAVDNGHFCGVGAAIASGDITLNYVSPNA